MEAITISFLRRASRASERCPSWSAPIVGTKPIVVDGWIDLRMERIDLMVGWIIGLEESLLLVSLFDTVDIMEAELFLWCSGSDDDDVSFGD